MPQRLILVAGLALMIVGCRSQPAPPVQDILGWRPVGTWSGRGDKQTETFTSDTGGFRVQWQTTNEAPAGGGRFKVVFRSGDSGTAIMETVNYRGVGRDTAYLGDRPRWYYVTIESANVDWSVTVDEPIIGRSGGD